MIKYPDGVQPPKLRSSLHTNKAVRKPRKKRFVLHWHAKYNNVKIHAFNHVFDSKVEYGFYLHLRRVGAIFSVHKVYVIKRHHLTPSGIPIRKRRYVPDFIRYRTEKDKRADKPYEVDDVKGIKTIPPADSYKFSDFEDKFDIPVVIIRWKHNHWTRQKKCF